MKKTLLTLLMVTPALAFAQSEKANISGMESMTLEKERAMMIDNHTQKDRTPLYPNGRAVKKKADVNYSTIVLGETYYDLQTNSSPGRRVLLHDDGTVSAVWTASPDDGTGFPSRGTGYNHYNGTDWLTGRNSRIENSRTGWPSIMLLNDGSEAVMAHESTNGGFVYSSNSSKGSTSFTSTGPILDDETSTENRAPIWTRSVQSNGKIHSVYNYWTNDGTVPTVTRNGVTSPTAYSRWDVATNSSEVEHLLLPGYDSTLYSTGGGDNYAIDARDSIVAIVVGGMGRALSLWKSTDNGQTWTYTDVDGFPYKTTLTEVLVADTPLTNDGSVDVLIDQQGMAHVFYGEGAVLDEDLSDESYSFFPVREHIRHWKEGDTETKRIAGLIDVNGDGETVANGNLNAETWNVLTNGAVPGTLLSASRTGNTSLTTMPSASLDDDGNIFVVYSAPIEGTSHFLNSNYRDVLITYSTDGGATWGEPQNVTKQGDWECTFPCVAKKSNDFVHLIFQQDQTPGTNLQNHSAAAGTHPIDLNEIKYAAIPVADIIADEIGQDISSIDDATKKAEVFVVSQNQPNPFYGSTDVLIYLRKNSEVSLTVTDVLGNVVNEGGLGIMSAGNHTISIDGNSLSTGMYFYTLSTGDHQITKKMQVK
jgi:hypothetical protein